jgi:hypothetical protein
MMKIFYSKETRGFYEEGGAVAVPVDAIEVTYEQRDDLLKQESMGGYIGFNEEGQPAIVDRPPPSEEEKKTINNALALIELQKSDTTVLRCYELGIPVPSEWVEYRQGLRDSFSGDVSKFKKPEYPKG